MSQVLGIPADGIEDDATADSLDAWTSMAHLNLVLALEDEFGIRFSDSQIPTLTSCAVIAKAITQAKGQSEIR
jgi:acyl carrier protein